MAFDLYEHYEALYDAMVAAAPGVTIVPVTSYEDQTGTVIDLPYITYRQETERSGPGTPGSGAAKILRSHWLISSYARDLEDAIANANLALSGIIDNEDNVTTDDGYVTTKFDVTGFMPLFEKENPNYVVHARVFWERSI